MPSNLRVAGHDIAFTMIAAILTALQNELYSKLFDADQLNTNHPQPVVQGCHIQDVIRNIIEATKVALALFWGKLCSVSAAIAKITSAKNAVCTSAAATVPPLRLLRSGILRVFTSERSAFSHWP